MKCRILVVDLEATYWKPGQHKIGLMKTIEIGAILANSETFEPLDEHSPFIRL